jgi:heme-degrading monooxygenase HmoA
VIVVTNRVLVAPEDMRAFLERVADRVGLVERHTGFVRLEVLQPKPGVLMAQEAEGAGAYLVLTYWASAEDFVTWTRSEDFRRAHGQRAEADPFAGPAVFQVYELVQTTEENDSTKGTAGVSG